MYQRCPCESIEPGGYAQWPNAFDFHQVVELCNCCGLEILRTGSRWSVWFCDECKQRVREVHERYRAYLLPIGRHSIMSGVGLTGAESKEPQKLSAFLGKTRALEDAINHLSVWARHIVHQNLHVLGFADHGDTGLLAYRKSAVDAGLDKRTAFEGLCKHFELDSSIVRMARPRSEDDRP
jgi:hypothetical protein